MEIFCGIDPGLNGGITLMWRPIDKWEFISTPMPLVNIGKKKRLNLPAIAEFIVHKGVPSKVAIELVGAMPGQGVTSMFSFGYGAGALEGILAALRIPYEIIRPQQWMKAVLRGLPKNEGKSSVIWCKRMFPNHDWRATPRCKNAHDGMTDSACLAYYAMKNF